MRAPRSSLESTRAGGVATLTITDGEAGLTPELHEALASAARDLDLDDELRVLVLRARGRVFCRSADDHGGVAATADAVAAVAALRVPVVCLLQGDAVDAGLELALACDLRVAAPGARLALSELSRGRLPRYGATQRLPRIVGQGRALAMLLLGESLSARAARDAGLVQRLLPARDLWRGGARLASDLAKRAPIAQRLAKEALLAASDLPLAEGLRLEGDLYVLLQSTADRSEGIASFHGRRAPVFRGR